MAVIRVVDCHHRSLYRATVLLAPKECYKRSIRPLETFYIGKVNEQGYVFTNGCLGEMLVRVRCVPFIPFENIINVTANRTIMVVLHFDTAFDHEIGGGWFFPSVNG